MLKKLPDDDKEIRRILLSFDSEKKRQAHQVIWTEAQAVAAVGDGATINFHVQSKEGMESQFEIMRELTVQPTYIYARITEGIEIPFAKIESEFTKATWQQIDTPVFVGDVKFYEHFHHGFENGVQYVYIGGIFKIPFAEEGNEPKECNFAYTLKGTLSKRISDSEFLIALSKVNKISIGETVTHDIQINNPEEIALFCKLNADFKKIKGALDYFGVKVDLDMDNLTPDDVRNIDYLIRAVEGNVVRYNEKDLPSSFCSNIKICNIVVRVLAKKDEEDDSGYRLFNLFTGDNEKVLLELTNGDGDKQIIHPWSLFLHMKAEDFLCSNVNLNVILDSIKAMDTDDLNIVIPTSDTQDICANNMLLEVFKAYDSQHIKDPHLLQFAIDVADILLSDDLASILNKLQAIKRQRKLTNDEIATLVIIRNKDNQTDVVKCATSILLGESESAKKLLNGLSEQDKKQITDYPIYSLMQD